MDFEGGLTAFRLRMGDPACEIWWMEARVGSGSPPESAPGLELLQEQERERYRRFRFERDRADYLAKRLLVRGALAATCGVPMEGWRFEAGPFGRPRIGVLGGSLSESRGLRGVEEIDFNLSASGGLAVCVVAPGGEIGIDVEDGAGPDASELAATVLSASERAAWERLPGEEQRVGLLRYWTLKEAYVKARGVGLMLPVDQICFEFAEADGISARFGPGVAEDAGTWSFRQFSLLDRYVVAIAGRR